MKGLFKTLLVSLGLTTVFAQSNFPGQGAGIGRINLQRGSCLDKLLPSVGPSSTNTSLVTDFDFSNQMYTMERPNAFLVI